MTSLRTQLEELAGKATKGEWEWDAGIIPPDGPGRYADIYVMGEDREPITLAEFNDSVPEGRVNATLIVALVNNLPTILAALDAVEWRSMADDPPPYRTPVEIRVGHMTLIATLEPNASVNSEGQDCDQWCARYDGEHPPCWSGGACWESNEDEDMSLQPKFWRPLGPVPENEHGR